MDRSVQTSLTSVERKHVQENLEFAGVISNCGNCEHGDLDSNKCKKFNLTPPMSISCKGCDEWELFIPF